MRMSDCKAFSNLFAAVLLPCCIVLSGCVSATLDLENENAQQQATTQESQDSNDAQAEPAPPSEPAARQSERKLPASARARECAIYFAVMYRLAAENRTSEKDVAEGCPAEADTGADLSPAGSAAPGGEVADQFLRKLVERGTPSDLAREVVRSRAFASLVNRS